MAQFKAISGNFPGGTEENYVKLNYDNRCHDRVIKPGSTKCKTVLGT
jgi:hypothetical protein